LVTFRDELARTENLDAVGGIEYVMAIVEGVPNAQNIAYYAKIVRNMSMLRSAIVIAADLDRKAYSGAAVADDVIASSVLGLDSILQRSSRSGWQRMSAAQAVDVVLSDSKATESKEPVKFGYRTLDTLVGGLRGGDYGVLAGVTSAGKTTLALNIVRNICANGKAVYFLSAEMRPDQLMQRLIATVSGVPLWKIRGGRVAESMTDQAYLEEAAEHIRSWNLSIDCVSRSPRQICTAAKTYMHEIRGPVDLVVIDYFQKLRLTSRYMKRYEMFSEISSALKQIALVELDIPILALSQFGRDVGKDERLPTRYDLKETGEIENDADLVMLLHRSPTVRHEDGRVLDEIWLKVDKQRQGMTNCWPCDGGHGAITLGRDSATLEMIELPCM
jgi:replicative DNA helicase